jgi:hypothetical protein
MRISITLENDVYETVKRKAAIENCSISMAINRLLRTSLRRREPSKIAETHFPVVKGRRPFSSSDVYRVEQSY